MSESQPFRAKKREGSTDLMIGKSLPTSTDAERSVLAAILLNDENLTLVSDILKSQDFHLKAHQIIYQAVIDLAQENKKIDLFLS